MTDPTLTVTLDRGGDPDNATYFASSVRRFAGRRQRRRIGRRHEREDRVFCRSPATVTATTTLSDANFEGSDYSLAPLSNVMSSSTYDGHDGNAYFSINRSKWRRRHPNRGDASRRHLSGGTIIERRYRDAHACGRETAIPLLTSTTQRRAGRIAGADIDCPAGVAAVVHCSNDSGSFIVTYTSTVSSTTHRLRSDLCQWRYQSDRNSFFGHAGQCNRRARSGIALSDGDFAVLTNTPTSNILQIYAPDGSTVGNAINLPTISDGHFNRRPDAGAPGMSSSATTMKDGNIYAIRFDNSGNIVAGGTQSSQASACRWRTR